MQITLLLFLLCSIRTNLAPWRIGSLVCYRIDRFDLNIIDVKLNIERAKQQPHSYTNFLEES